MIELIVFLWKVLLNCRTKINQAKLRKVVLSYGIVGAEAVVLSSLSERESWPDRKTKD